MLIDKPELDLFCPVLNFGRKKTGRYKFPIVFKNEKKAIQLHDELKPLLGKSIDEVKTACNPLYEKYKMFDYRAALKK